MPKVRYTAARTGIADLLVPGYGVFQVGREVDVDDETAASWTTLHPTAAVDEETDKQIMLSDFALVVDPNEASAAELRERAAALDLSTSGSKADLADRIAGAGGAPLPTEAADSTGKEG